MKRPFFREYKGILLPDDGDRPAEQWNIGVTGLGRSVGTTFVASSLAFYLQSKGKTLTFCQCLHPKEGRSLLYDEAAMDQRFSNRKFEDIYIRLAENAPVRGIVNMEKGIHWILPTPEDREKGVRLDEQQRMRLINCARGNIAMFDLSAEDEWNSLLPDMDFIVAVCDPLPSRLIACTERFKLLKRLELSGRTVVWVCNKVNNGISRRQIASYLKTKDIIWVPGFDPALIYADEFVCRFHWENEEIRNNLLEIFTKVSLKMGV
ncbi:hypothetical protein ACPW7J_10570 [Ihubacter sp. rT4E-8]|uniref:hypothetical protein n=1 Tax=unclassified Ihubacter TaxID=2633299 RepID=UPI003C7AFD37